MKITPEHTVRRRRHVRGPRHRPAGSHRLAGARRPEAPVHRIAAGEVRRPSYDTVHRLERLQRSLETKRKG
jgi:hypothetical protein